MTPRRNQRSAISGPQLARAFTLIELMVVIGIIVLLVGLTVGVSVILHQKSEQRQVEQMFQLLDMAMQEWEQVAERQMTYGTNVANGVSFDISPEINTPDDAHELMHGVISLLGRSSASKQILTRLNPDFLKEHDPGEIAVFDPWGRDCAAVFPGRSWTQSDPADRRDNDGTYQSDLERALGACDNRRVYFVSAGPDGKFGDLSADPVTQAYKDSLDNVYSYPVVKP